jgi:hypothetical protein
MCVAAETLISLPLPPATTAGVQTLQNELLLPERSYDAGRQQKSKTFETTAHGHQMSLTTDQGQTVKKVYYRQHDRALFFIIFQCEVVSRVLIHLEIEHPRFRV